MKKHLTKYSFRPFLYSFIITVGFTILITILNDGLEREFWIGALILFSIILLELFLTANYYHIEHRKNTNSIYDFESNKIIQYTHHIFLPTLLYVTLVAFVFFNNQPSLIFLNLLITFFSFFILLENIHSFYKHKFALHKSTNYIYDILGVFIIFLMSFDAIELIRYNRIENQLLIICMFAVIYGVNIGILTIRNSITRLEILAGIVFTFSLTLIGQITVFQDISPISIAFVIAVLYRAYTLFINYSIEHLIDKEQLWEDFIMLMLVASLLNLYLR